MSASVDVGRHVYTQMEMVAVTSSVTQVPSNGVTLSLIMGGVTLMV